MLCTKCGHVSPESARFCAQCGNVLAAPRPTPTPSAAPASTAPPSPNSGEAHAKQRDTGAAAATAGQPANKAGEAAKKTGLPPSDTERPSPSDEEVQNKQLLWLIIAIVALAIAGLANWLYSLYRDSGEFALSLPVTHITKPAASPSPPRQMATAPVAPPAAPLAASAVTSETSAAPAQAAETSRKSKTRGATNVHLNDAQMNRLVTHLQSRSAPASCDDAIARAKQLAHLSQTQAKEIAIRAYPGLCAPAAVATAPEPPPPPPRKAARTVDQAWHERVASECGSGFGGVVCGEKLRYKLCEGRWTENPSPGQSICQQAR